jgi:hypothetical protein
VLTDEVLLGGRDERVARRRRRGTAHLFDTAAAQHQSKPRDINAWHGHGVPGRCAQWARRLTRAQEPKMMKI